MTVAISLEKRDFFACKDDILNWDLGAGRTLYFRLQYFGFFFQELALSQPLGFEWRH